MALGEFDLIRRYFQRSASAADLSLGIGDDCAILRKDERTDWVITSDSMVAGVHFPASASAADIAHKLLHVNASDCAAMGAQPRFALLALTLPAADADWLDEFSRSLHQQLQLFDISLIGGDTTRGPLNLNLTLIGEVPRSRALRRDRAQVGDCIVVSGTPGDAALGLQLALGKRQIDDADLAQYCLQRLHRPQARVSLGLQLRGMAHAAIDISDGLVQDLQHILNASQVGAELDVASLPLSPALRQLGDKTEAEQMALSGGDDYELLLTIPATNWQALQSSLSANEPALHCIGRIVATPGLRLLHAAPQTLQRLHLGAGYQHF